MSERESRGVAGNDRVILAEVAGRIDPPTLACEIVAALRDEIEAYGCLPERVGADVLDNVRASVDTFLKALERGARDDGDFEFIRQAARDRSGDGVPLDDLLRAYRLGSRIGWEALTRAATPEESGAMVRCAGLVLDWVDRVSAIVEQTYLTERRQSPLQEEARVRALLGALVSGEPLDPASRELAERMGLCPEGRHRVFAVVIAGQPARVHGQVASQLRAMRVAAVSEGHQVRGLASQAVANLAGLIGSREKVVLAVGEDGPRAELAQAFEEVQLLVEIACRLGRVGEVSAEMLLPELFLAHSPRLAALLRRRALNPLAEYSERGGMELLPTLDALFACGLDRRQAAGRLHVHPNTFGYRLRRVQEITGLRLDRADDLLLIWLALKTRVLAADSPTP
ncbi:MAG: helix-turn-helix domain-containing protein [Acidobacteria bacterium]|nr:helix-turn-helix domain-containing protein [Acidobacteriota bacterium]